jgi:hypothetical protein
MKTYDVSYYYKPLEEWFDDEITLFKRADQNELAQELITVAMRIMDNINSKIDEYNCSETMRGGYENAIYYQALSKDEKLDHIRHITDILKSEKFLIEDMSPTDFLTYLKEEEKELLAELEEELASDPLHIALKKLNHLEKENPQINLTEVLNAICK